jgi:hypothetical protein
MVQIVEDTPQPVRTRPVRAAATPKPKAPPASKSSVPYHDFRLSFISQEAVEGSRPWFPLRPKGTCPRNPESRKKDGQAGGQGRRDAQ